MQAQRAHTRSRQVTPVAALASHHRSLNRCVPPVTKPCAAVTEFLPFPPDFHTASVTLVSSAQRYRRCPITTLPKEALKVSGNTRPVSIYPSHEFYATLRNLSGKSLRVLLGLFAWLDENRVAATQSEIGEHLGIHRSGVSRALTELRECGWIFQVKRGQYTVNGNYLKRGSPPRYSRSRAA